MCGNDTPQTPSSTPDCNVSNEGTVATCPAKDDSIKLVELVEVYRYKKAWKQRAVDARRQFINLDDEVDAANEHPEFGRAVWLKARLEWVSGDKTRSLAGKSVYWYSKPDAANNATLTIAQKGSFDSAGGGQEKKDATTDKDGWTKEVPFYLSLYGGDKHEVYATLDKGYKGGLKAGAYEVWRKFWFKVSEMTDRAGAGRYELPAGAAKTITDGYEKAKIEFLEKGPRGSIPYQANVPSDAEMDKMGSTHFGSDDLIPFKCHLMTCDYAKQVTENKEVKDKLTATSWSSPNWYTLWPHDGALGWKIEAQYKDGANWKDIPAAGLSEQVHASQPGYKKVAIDFSKGPVTPSAKTPIDIKLKLKCSGPNYFLGWGGGRAHILLCTGMVRDITSAAERDPMQQRTVVHEIGHALGLVNRAPAKSGAHDAWEDKAHANHCNRPAKECAMYWQNSSERPTTFHSIGGAGCNEHLRTEDFSRSVMKPLWK